MVEIEDKIISDELFEKKFVCDLQKCKGGCCVEGDSGAPLKSKEIKEIAKNLSIIKSEMSTKGLNAIKNNDFHYFFKVSGLLRSSKLQRFGDMSAPS